MTSKFWVNNAHDNGFTTLAFSRDGSYAYTGGTEALIRVWDMSQGDRDEPSVAMDANENISCLTASDEYWFSGSIDSDLRKYKKNQTDMIGIITSAKGLAIRSAAVDPKSEQIAVASEEPTIKIINLLDTTEAYLLDGHKRAIRRVTWHPSGELLTSCAEDGQIIVWDVTEKTSKIEKVIEDIISPVVSTNPDYDFDCSAIWHPSGEHFYIAGRTNTIIIVAKSTWTKVGEFADASISERPTSYAISPNGLYMAIAFKTGLVTIWSTKTRQLLYRHETPEKAAITGLGFVPGKNMLGWTDHVGCFSRWVNPIPSDVTPPFNVTSTASSSTTKQSAAKSSDRASKDDLDLWGDAMRDVDEAENDDGTGDIDFEDSNWIIDDVGGGLKDAPKEQFTGKEFVSITKAQPAFQPGATPLHNKRRYLAHNMVGVVEVTDQDTHHIVTVEFHDKSLRKGFHWTDQFKFDLAALGERGGVFACQPVAGHPARVTFKSYNNTQPDWSYELTKEKTKVLAVAAGASRPASSNSFTDDMKGHGMVVVATSESDLTFITGEGQEMFVMGLDGELVSMVAGPEWLFLVHRPGAATIDGSQNLMGSLISFEDFSMQQRVPLPIPKGHTLKWIGVTEEGAPAVYDSNGMIHVMTNFRRAGRGNWARVLDTFSLDRRAGKDESYWPVGLNKDTFHCLILKGRQEYPTFPRPLIQEIATRIPFRGVEKDTTLEEAIAREQMHLNFTRDTLGEELTMDDISKRENEQDKKLITLIQSACKGDRIARVLALVNQLHHVASFDIALKVADFYHLSGLKEKIHRLKQERLGEDRLEKARDRRRDWMDEQASPPRRAYADTRNSYADPLNDVRPIMSNHRPGLAPANPVVVNSAYSANNLSQTPQPFRPSSTNNKSLSPSPESKRKRAVEDEDDQNTSFEFTQDSMGPPRSKPNPFAKKAAIENRNPFARKVEPEKVLHKSESFFDKVDAFESRPPTKLKESGRKSNEKGSSKQTTLFGLPGPKSKEKQLKKRRQSEPEPSASLIISDTQSTDVSMDEQMPSSMTLEDETQLDDSQLDETQISDVSQSHLTDTQLVEEPSESDFLEQHTGTAIAV